MKYIYLFVFIAFVCLGCRKEKSGTDKYDNCIDSILSVGQKKLVRSNAKFFLDYRFGLTESEYDSISKELGLAGKIKTSDYEDDGILDFRGYFFDYQSLKDKEFALFSSYHNDSLSDLYMLYFLDSLESDSLEILASVNAILKNKYQSPVCKCDTGSVWVSEGKYLKVRYVKEKATPDSEKSGYFRFVEVKFMDLALQIHKKKNSNTILEVRNEKNGFNNTYDQWYYDKVITPRENKKKAVEAAEAAKDL